MEESPVYKLSSDIEFSKFNESEYLLHNVKLNKYTKLNQKYYDLLSLADGSRTVSQINMDFQKSHKVPISDSQIILLFGQLKQYGTFGHDDSIKEQSKIPDYIKYGFIFLKPEVISTIVPFLKLLFVRKVFYSVIFFSIIIFGYSIYTNYYNNPTLNSNTFVPYFILLLFISTIFHELGHASASHFFKARHGGIGFGFYLYFIPAFFADVTDIWRLSKWKRIIVNSAGIYFEIIFCLLLLIIGFFIKYHILEILALAISVKALYNLIPFLRADGYWILSDLLNKPNLNFHAMNNLKLILLSTFKNEKSILTKKDYLIALYGGFNIVMIALFFYYQIFLNWYSIINFPITIYKIVISIFQWKFNLSFNELFKLLSVLIFYIISVKIILGIMKR
ncbi:hypothetical protein EG346_21390 [Chryseobacterium carnipullorum]|uniref:Peptide zinc metalloprotease protein n=7 Tax=Weeksellaceae TaxID=2762318 RepID=A0A3G6RIG3_CHRLC|nr:MULTISPECIES: hypothetical protein [Weeksellaceae]QIY82483.1 hypothetical protein HER18_02450 [Chryseobacterium sp. NEB161]AQX86129.1 hypothetical protein AYC65_14445 [Elizabethkingia bruuniana]AZA50575.1 hypothetical protein EG346_21390 [Chryseobacterium carnipullorum]AZA65443.1 hypothetical protein EG345_12470 [Chryseobacterium carnipullorum]AZA83268.1 hypothetical protein EG342_15905 [Chryseobacterium lactis]